MQILCNSIRSRVTNADSGGACHCHQRHCILYPHDAGAGRTATDYAACAAPTLPIFSIRPLQHVVMVMEGRQCAAVEVAGAFGALIEGWGEKRVMLAGLPYRIDAAGGRAVSRSHNAACG
jgi:hypothetical protein